MIHVTSNHWSNFLSKLPGDLDPKIHVSPRPCWVLESLAFKTVICKYNSSLWTKKRKKNVEKGKEKGKKKKKMEKKMSFVFAELNIHLRRHFKTWSQHDAPYVGPAGSWPYGSWGERCWERPLLSSMGTRKPSSKGLCAFPDPYHALKFIALAFRTRWFLRFLLSQAMLWFYTVSFKTRIHKVYEKDEVLDWLSSRKWSPAI